MGDGTRENPYTREDVLRLIKEHGDKAEGLDLSGKTFIDGIDLSGLDLKGIILKNVQCFSLSWLGAMMGVYLEEDVLGNTNPKEVMSSGAHFEKSRLIYAHLEGADLIFSHFESSDLSRAHLEGANLAFGFFWGACLVDAHFEGARLSGAQLEGAALGLAHLKGAPLGGAKFTADTKLDGVDWGNYVLGEEKDGAFPLAAQTYRRLKQWYTDKGYYDIAGEFFFREMTAKRKDYWWGDIPKRVSEADAFSGLEQALANISGDAPNNPVKTDTHHPAKLKRFPYALFPKKPLNWAWSKLISLLCGYGEKPERTVVSASVIVFGLAAAYYLWGSFNTSSVWDTLYYSAVSFTAVGYGNWAPQPTGWAKGVGVLEAFVGFFMMTLFLVTFTRKMTR